MHMFLQCNERNTTVCCKFTQLHSYQILLKLVNIWLSYCENKKGERFFETQCILLVLLTKVWVLTLNQFLQLMLYPLWSGWFRPASQSLMPRPTYWRQQSKRSSLSTSGLAPCDRRTVIITLKVTGIQHPERPHHHWFQHFQRKMTQLLQQTSEHRLEFSHRLQDTLLLV